MTITPPERTRVVAPSAHVRSDAAERSLNGTWDFRLIGNPDTAGQIEVPSHWVLPAGERGHPIYTNLAYPIPVDAPFVPDDTPTAEYTRDVDIPADWLESGRVFLRTDGIESCAEFFIDGVRAGSRLGSRLVHELDVTDLLSAGTVQVRIVVRQWSVGTYLEDQDQWWLPGIFRDVTLRHRPLGCLDDVWVDSSYAVETGEGVLRLDVHTDDAGWPVRLQIAALGVDETFDSAAEIESIRIPAVTPWSDETPVLYDVTVHSTSETVRLRTGFRSIDVRGGVLCANGQPLKLRGMNRHEVHPDRGRVFDEAFTRADLELMKRYNVNAIRTSHYPPHPRLLDLADEYGLWVMLECDFETHGYELVDWRGNPSADPAWLPHLLDRIERTVERDKNHPSIFSWSLGNESGQGANLAAMAAWVQARDESRLLVYEGDHSAAFTQLYARMYPAFEEIAAFLADDGPIAVAHHPASAVTETEAARARKLPYVLIEYLHAMGTGPGGIAAYEQIIAAEPRIAGGFVWEWRDHALRHRTDSGTEYLAYGGDFGEVLHDGTFIADGMVSADSVVSTGLREWAHCVAPVRAQWGSGGIEVSSAHVHAAITVEVAWRLECAGDLVVSGTASATVEPAAVSVIGVPEALAAVLSRTVESHLTCEVRHDASAAPWLRGVLISASQHRFAGEGGGAGVAAPSPARPHIGERLHRFGPAQISARTGRIVRLGDWDLDDDGLTLWRPPTDNDLGHGALDYTDHDPVTTLGAGAGFRGPSAAERWIEAGLDRLVVSSRPSEWSDGAFVVHERWGAAGAEPIVACTRTWTAVSDSAVRLRLDVVGLGDTRMIWPRVSLPLALPAHPWLATWVGDGPHESYPDMRATARFGRHTLALEEFVTTQVRPQESGHRSGLRVLSLSAGDASPALEVRVVAGALGFHLSPWSAAEITRAEHPHELPEPTRTHLALDLAIHGLGSRSCGPDVRPEHQLRAGAFSVTVEFALR